MERLRNTISFTTYTKEQYWYTYIDLKLENISITAWQMHWDILER